MPILSDTNTLTNNYNYKIFKELYENNVSTFSFSFQGANSLSGDDIKLSERLYIPGNKFTWFWCPKKIRYIIKNYIICNIQLNIYYTQYIIYYK